jgi:hypothetical protein
MKKVKLNTATDRTRRLISYLNDLEACDRDRMSSDGKYCMDKIWKLLGLPTHDELPFGTTDPFPRETEFEKSQKEEE